MTDVLRSLIHIPAAHGFLAKVTIPIFYGVAFVSKIKIDLLTKIDWQIDWKMHSQLNRSAKCRRVSKSICKCRSKS